jgi:hypothetical protein
MLFTGRHSLRGKVLSSWLPLLVTALFLASPACVHATDTYNASNNQP